MQRLKTLSTINSETMISRKLMSLVKSVKPRITLSRCLSSENTQPPSEELSSSSSSANEVEKESTELEPNPQKPKLGGFAQALERFTTPAVEKPKVQRSFAHLLRHSKFVDLGDPQGKVVTGKIFHVVGDDLYIDFDWKFHCVCPRPAKNGENYVEGAIVKLRIKELELSTKFIGSDKDLTILEADCTLLGLWSSNFSPQEQDNKAPVNL